MRVLILATGYPRWKGDFNNVYLHRLAKSLVSEGIEVHVLVPDAQGLKKTEMRDGVIIHRFQYMYPRQLQTLAYFPGIPEKIKILSGKLQIIPFLLSMAVNLLKMIRKYNIHIINAHWAIPPGFIAVLTKYVHKRPVLLTLYGAEIFPLFRNGIMSFLKPFVRYAIKKSDKVVGISDTTCEASISLSGRRDIRVLPDGIDTELFRPNIDGHEIRKRYNIENGYLIFSSGRMVERKGFLYLVKAVREVIKKYPNTFLILGGDGPEKKKLQALVKELKLEKNVFFPGFIPEDDFPKYMRACDIFVLPSIVDSRGDTEGSATILLEAMACGTPVIGTRVGGIPFAIKDGIGGYLVEQKDYHALAEKIIYLIEHPEIRNNQGSLGRTYVIKNFSWKKIAIEYKKYFFELLKSSS